MRAGTGNGLTDVTGLRVGHAALTGPGARSGSTVVLAPPGGAVAGADVRGAAPGTRETDLLLPTATVQRVHAITLSGGSAFGLDAASGVMARLERDGEGFPVPGAVVPIVPAAVVFDLGRGGDPAARPTAETGAAAYDAAHDGPVGQGSVGAGTGAVAGGLRGGIGTASAVLGSGATVAALVVLNSAGTAVDPATGVPFGARYGLPGEFPGAPAPADRVAELYEGHVNPLGTATTLVVLATDAALDKPGCTRLATMAHDGLARSIHPVHTLRDGDCAFGLATGTGPAPDVAGTFELQAAAADVTARAVVHALLAAEAAPDRPSYSSLVAG
ncbi:hydrolase [Pseudonocardia sp. EC080610-09]|uniref:P1 family peptidase n=1 Tax=unclassified Pseudonocardia TaxID=2619320 RepID=UPI0006CB2C20|nr:MULTISPECIES: P1 family peptidase [unclassified Pseudonocardia]ALE72033.1 hydrolase [Pseudonocardia sp. EC080625-04]ALL75311.1 hydrolase [Pseudonocardia sp. EC080610-09]ALL82336.1 hydrolase [Pseudonocardia sp. EC080619-01]